MSANDLIAAALVAAVLVVVLAFVVHFWRDPFALVRVEYARQRRALGLSRRSVDIDGQRWCYVEGIAGASAANLRVAPTLVLLHGYTGSKENWYRLAQRLRGRYRLVIPDLPGWGESQRDAGADYGYSAQAARVAAFIAAISEQPVVLIGHSMGGGISAVVAARYPQSIARVALLSASGVRFADNSFGRDVLDGKNPFGVDDRASLARYFEILFHDQGALPPMPWPAARVVIAQRRADAAFEQAVLDRIGRGGEQFLPGDEAAKIRQPTLLLWGAQDRVIDPSAMALFAARVPQAQQALLDGSGHMTLMEQPDAVAAALLSWLDS